MGVYQRFLAYGVAIGSTSIALLLSLWSEHAFEQTSVDFFYIAIATSTWYGGKRLGFVAIVLSVLALSYLFTPPTYQLQIAEFEGILQIVLFVIVSLIINLLTGSLQNNKRKIELLNRQIIEESASRLKVALNAAQMGMWDWNILTGEISWSPEHEQLFGLSPGSFDGSYETFDARLYPDDRKGLNQVVADALKNRTPYHHEYRVVWMDGSIHWVEGRGQAFYSEDGEPMRMSGTIMAIDGRKEAEAALKEQEAILRLFAQYAPAGIAMFDREMCYVMTSQRWADDYSLGSLQSLIGRSHYDVLPEVPERWKQIHQRCLAGAIETCDEDLFVRADGTEQWIRWEVRPWHVATGAIGGIIVFSEEITERKRAEAALRESEERYRVLIQNFPNGAVCLFDRDLRYVVAGGQGLADIGLDPTMLEGKTIWEAFDPETCHLLEADYRSVLAGHSQIVEIPYSGRIYRSHLLPLYDNRGVVQLGVSMTQNITLQKQAEQALKASRDDLERQVQERTRELQEANALLQQREREFRTLVENTPDMITRHDRQYRNTYTNPASYRVVGLPPEFFIGKKPSELGYPEEIAQLWESSLESVFVTGKMQIDEFTLMNSNQTLSYQVYIVPERETDQSIASVMTIGRDITQLRQAEASSRQLAEELQRSNHELEQFAYVASHDLQEPLRAVTSFTQMLAKRYQGQLDAKADTYIEFIVDGATRMQQLIKDLLAYSRVGRYELKRQPVDFNALLERIKKDLQVAIAENHAVITADFLPTVTADPSQMVNLLQNLIGNSLKYRTDAEPRIHISAKNMAEDCNASSQASASPSTISVQEWQFSIQDNGIGIEPVYAERIFGIFQRLHASDEYSGTGLGLAICRKIIERHEGRIWVESQLGQGATFHFTIPISTRT